MSLNDDSYYPEQRECAWLACDRQGAVALFLTAGEGPMPESVFNHPGTPLHAVEKQVMQLAHTSSARTLVSVAHPDGYLEVARHGLFVYDWTDVHAHSPIKNAYEKVAVPESPIQLNSLPRDLQLAARAVVFPDLSFADSPLIDVVAFGPCRVSALS